MAAPFFDLGLVQTALQSLVPGTVASVIQVGDASQADPERALWDLPALVIGPRETEVEGPGGLGNSRTVRETFEVVLQWRDTAGDSTAPAAGLRALRAALWGELEALRIDPQWAPLRYAGGALLSLDDDVYSWSEFYQTETGTCTAPRLPD
jgi:hypothetical protein